VTIIGKIVVQTGSGQPLASRDVNIVVVRVEPWQTANVMGGAGAGSISLGRWLGIPVRLHVSFFFLAIFLLFVFTRSPFNNMAAHGGLLILVWFLCAILHEAGHCIAVARLGGRTDGVVLTPLGGLSHYTYLQEPHRELIAAMAGPLASFCGWFAGACLLFALGDVTLVGLLNPLAPQGLFDNAAAVRIALRFSVFLNWTLVLINLLPAIPFDVGWAIRCVLLQMPQMGHQRAVGIVRRFSMVVALGLFVAAIWMTTWETDFVIPAWLALAVLGVCVSSYVLSPIDSRDEQVGEDEIFGYDFSQGYTSLERRDGAQRVPDSGPLRRWIERRRLERDAQRQRQEQEEEQQVDRILARLHEDGISSLSPDERALLNRVSARYRERSSN
jgi:stage IV sporulation protein FB